MAILTDEIKTEIVIQISQFQGYSQVARYVNAEFGVAVDRFQVRTYDPTNAAYAGGDKWRDLFTAARANYLASVEAVPLSHKGYRLNELQRLYNRTVSMGNVVLAASLLEQAAKEAGGALTNERSLKVEQGAVAGFRNLTSEERRAAVAEMLRAAVSMPGSAAQPKH